MNEQTSTSTSTTSVSQVTTNTNPTVAVLTATPCANDNDRNSAGAPSDSSSPSHVSGCVKNDPISRVEFKFERKCHLEQVPDHSRGSDSCKESAIDHKFWWNRTRIHVALLGLTIAAVNCYAQATFCIAIVEMILPADYVVKLEDTGQQSAVIVGVINGGNQTHQMQPIKPFFDHADQSCPIELKYRDYYDSWRFPQSAQTATTAYNSNAGNVIQQQQASGPATADKSLIDISNRFDWDAQQQGLLLGAFAIGTAPLQVIGGRLAEIYGSKWVLLMGCIGTALTNLTIPYIAHFSFVLLLLNRVVMGIAQAGMEPGLMCLLADWLTPKEAGFFISMLLFAICMGFFLGSLCSSFILALGYGWPLTYYVSGGLNLIVGLIWYIYADSWPHASKYINQNELDYITHEQKRHQARKQLEEQAGAPAVVSGGNDGDDLSNASSSIKSVRQSNISMSVGGGPYLANQIDVPVKLSAAATPLQLPLPVPVPLASSDPIDAPWLNILATPSVWAFIICKISIRWCADVLANELPLYLANVLHLSIKINGLLNSMSTALFAISSFVSGWLANEIFVNKKSAGQQCGGEQVNKTRVRKLFQSVASFGSAICIILMTRYDCDIILSMSMLLILSCCLVMGTGGELQIPYDMTSRYPGTLHGMACTLSVSGWLAPPLIGLILADQPSSRYRWSIVWYSTAAINIIGGLVFVLFADASPKDFDRARSGSGNGRKARSQPGDNSNDNNNDLRKQSNNRAERSSTVTDQDQQQQQQLGYTNIALSSSSCENSPKLKHNQYHLSSTQDSHRLATNASPPQVLEQVPHQQKPAGRAGQRPLSVASACEHDKDMLFDSDKLFKIRQLESTFIRPSAYNYPIQHDLDSPIDRDVYSIMLPFREDPTGAGKQEPINAIVLDNTGQQRERHRSSSETSHTCFPNATSASSGELGANLSKAAGHDGHKQDLNWVAASDNQSAPTTQSGDRKRHHTKRKR